jgi:hypothetical protein
MKEITLRCSIDTFPIIPTFLVGENLKGLIKKAEQSGLYLLELDTARIQDYHNMTYVSPVILFQGGIPSAPDEWAVISKRDRKYCLDFCKSIREVER